MNMFDEARAIRGMIEMCAMTQGDIAKKMGVSQSYIANKLRLLKFDEETERIIIDSHLTERHARAILRIPDKEGQRVLIRKVSERKMTVRECEAAVDLAVTRRLPTLIGKADKAERIELFLSFIKTSVEGMASLGIRAKREISYHGNKKYVLITIEE